MVNGIRISMNTAAATVILIISAVCYCTSSLGFIGRTKCGSQTGESDVIAIETSKKWRACGVCEVLESYIFNALC